jgi:hypothetical protein
MMGISLSMFFKLYVSGLSPIFNTSFHPIQPNAGASYCLCVISKTDLFPIIALERHSYLLCSFKRNRDQVQVFLGKQSNSWLDYKLQTSELNSSEM